jgi:hypothetical protein
MTHSIVLAIVVIAAGLCEQVDDSRHARAVEAIRKLGGTVRYDDDSAGKALIVSLTAARQPVDCLPHLGDLANLRSLDL